MTTLTYYMPGDDAGKHGWLKNFKTKLPTYASLLGLSAAVVNQVADDYINFDAATQAVTAMTNYKKSVVKYKDEIKRGNANNKVLGALNPAPALPAFATTPILGDVFGRITLLVKNIKSNPAYIANPHIGEDLGIIGAEPGPTPPGGGSMPTERTTELKPVLKIKLNKGNRPWIKWKKGDTHALKLLVDRGTGTFALLTVATHHTYTDMFALPATGVAVVWKYKAIYLDNHEDEEGMYSEIAQITVTGV